MGMRSQVGEKWRDPGTEDEWKRRREIHHLNCMVGWTGGAVQLVGKGELISCE